MNKRNAILALTLAAAIMPTQVEAKLKDNCPQWAGNLERYGLSEEVVDYNLHLWGCKKPYNTWERGTTRCERLAYELERRDKFTFVGVGRHRCVLEEDGSWSQE